MFLLSLLIFIYFGKECELAVWLFAIAITCNLAAIIFDALFHEDVNKMTLLHWNTQSIYKSTKMNMVSCQIICWLIRIGLDLVHFSIWVIKAIYYITHVGRED